MLSIIVTYRLTYKHPEHTQEALNSCDYAFDSASGELTIRFHAESNKWYTKYGDVAALLGLFEAFREEADKPGSAVSGSFVKVGESDDDIESDRYGDASNDLVYAIRSIGFDCSPGVSLAEASGDAA